MTPVRQAPAVTLGASRERSWRVLFASVLSALYALAMLSSVSVLLSDGALAERETMRTVNLSGESRPTDVFIRLSQDYWHGERIFVAFISPADVTEQGALPPGMRELPEPGEAVVSPALDALAREESGLARLYPRRTVLDDEGVGSATELIAYVRPPRGRGLGAEAAALRRENGTVTGDPVTARIAEFGGEAGLPVFADERRPWWRVPALAMVVGVLPALLLLALGLRESAPRSGRGGLDPRGPGATVRDAVVSSFRRAASGIAVGATAWLVVSSLSELVPLTRVPVVQGHRPLPLTFAVVAVVTCIALAGIAVVSAPRGSRSRTPRPLTPLRTNLRLLPLAASAVLFAVHGLTSPGAGLPLVAVATAGAVVGVCTALPVLLQRVGQRLTTSPRGISELVGRSLQDEPAHAARPFYGLVVLIVAALMSVPSSTASRAAAPVVGAPGGVSAVGVEWFDVRVGDFASFSSALRSGEAFPVGSPANDGRRNTHDEGGSAALVGASCAQLARVITLDCPAGRPRRPTAQGEAEVARLVGSALGRQIQDVVLVDPGRLETSGRLVVLGKGDVASLDAETRVAARAALPGALVDSEVFYRDPSRSDQRLIDSFVSRWLVLLGVTALLVAVDRVIVEGTRRRPAGRRSATSRSFLRRFLVLRFLAGWWSAGLFAIAIGYVVRIQTSAVSDRAGLWQGVSSVVVGLIVGTLIGALGIFAVGAHESERVTGDLQA